jgi:hypothetical protein
MVSSGIITCAQCGERGFADTQFCGVCGAFLNWDTGGERPRGNTPPDGTRLDVVQPAEQRKPVHPVLPAEADPPPLNPGDLICGECGMGNPPTRKFCSRCGTSLAVAATVALPWWRRWLPARKPKAHEAGSRPRGRRRRGGNRHRIGRVVRRVLAVALVLVGLLYAAYPPFRHVVNGEAVSLKNKVTGIFVTRYEPVRPIKVIATVETPGHGANLVSDNAVNTYWAAPAGGTELALVLTFDRPVDLRRAIVRVGIGADFQSAHRPQKLHLVYSTGKTYDLALADTPDAQTLPIENSAGATSVEVHVAALNRSLQGKDVAVSEIELFEAMS